MSHRLIRVITEEAVDATPYELQCGLPYVAVCVVYAVAVCRRNDVCSSQYDRPMCRPCQICQGYNVSSACVEARASNLFDNPASIIYAALILFWGASYVHTVQTYSFYRLVLVQYYTHKVNNANKRSKTFPFFSPFEFRAL